MAGFTRLTLRIPRIRPLSGIGNGLWTVWIPASDIADGAFTDTKIGNRTLVGNVANATLVPIAAKSLTAKLQGIRYNLKYLFNNKFYHASRFPLAVVPVISIRTRLPVSILSIWLQAVCSPIFCPVGVRPMQTA